MQNFVKITLVLTEISTEMTEILIGIVNYDGQCISKAYLGFLPSNILYDIIKDTYCRDPTCKLYSDPLLVVPPTSTSKF